jgi:hypothetical protein
MTVSRTTSFNSQQTRRPTNSTQCSQTKSEYYPNREAIRKTKTTYGSRYNINGPSGSYAGLAPTCSIFRFQFAPR